MTFIPLRGAFRALSCLSLASTATLCCAIAARAEVTISTNKTKHMNCTGGVCSPTAPKAVLNVTDLANMLAAGNVTVKSDSAALDIHFAAPLSWMTKRRLTLDSFHSVVFQTPIAITGKGAMTITTNDGGSHGDFLFEDEGKIEYWDLRSSLIINGTNYTLANTIKQLAKAIAKKPAGFYALAKDYDAATDGTCSQSPIASLSGTVDGLGKHNRWVTRR